MKLTREEIGKSGGMTPLQLFSHGIRADATRRKYTATLRRITCDILEDILEGDFEERVAQFVQHGKDNPDWVLDLLISLSWKLRARSELPKDHTDYLNPTSFKTYFKPIRKLLEMNDITINWRRVYSTLPEKDNVLDTKGWTREEIMAILVHARDPMDRAIVLLLASSGVRLGGLNMTWGDLTPIYLEDGRLTTDPSDEGDVVCVALDVYAGSPEKYTAFATPEAYAAILKYGRTWANMMCRQPRPDDHLFLATKLLPRKASEPSIAKRVREMATKAGLREQNKKKGVRFETQLVHGFRKFFNKTCKEALSGDSLASLIRTEYMMGHTGLVSLDQSYFKTSMLEMAAEYLKVVPDLTIDDADRLRRSNRTMSSNIQKLEREKDEKLERLTREINDIRQERNSMRQEMLELKKQRELPAADLLNLLKKESGSDDMSQDVLQSLTGMIQ